jgi:hypothetical protein
MDIVLVVLISIILLMVFIIMGYALVVQFVTKARRYAVTLKGNQGAFVALCTQKRWDRWTFEDVKLMPTNPGGAVVQADKFKLYVPKRNILYYQEIMEVANVGQ